MRIIELEEVKDILGITDTTYDDRINRLLPFVQDDVVNYLNNAFRDRNTYYASATIELNNADPPTITDTEEEFLNEGFEAGMDIYVEGTQRNNDIYTIATAAAGTLTLAATDHLYSEGSTDEYGGNVISITHVRWPKGLKIYVAQMIWENIDRARNKGIKSRTLGPSSVTYESIEGGGYSKSILNGLGKWRLMNTR